MAAVVRGSTVWRLVVLVVGRGTAPGVEERVRTGVAERLHALGVRNVGQEKQPGQQEQPENLQSGPAENQRGYTSRKHGENE